MADFDATQAIDLSDCDDETDDDVSEADKKPVAHLKVLSHKGFPETLFPIYDGNNVVGRQEGSCNVFIPLKALSKQHACIEVRGEQHFIVDKGSRNKTRRGKMFLLPEAKYELQSGDQLMFADITCVYTRASSGHIQVRTDIDKVDDSGSETGSESMLLPEEDGGKKALIEETMTYEEASDPSSDLLPVTQAFPADDTGLHQPLTSISVPDSDPEPDPEEDQDCNEPFTVAETPAVQRTKAGVGGDTETMDVKRATVALTETLTYGEEEEEGKERVARELMEVYDSGEETDEDDNENCSSAIFEAATQVCVDYEAETQVCVDFEAETQVVADRDTAGNTVSKVEDTTPKKIEKETARSVFVSGDVNRNDVKSTYSDSDSSCGSPIFPSSLGRDEEGNKAVGAISSVTRNLYVGDSPTLSKKQELADTQFTRPFPVGNKSPIVKSCVNDRNKSPKQPTSTVTSDMVLRRVQDRVVDTGSVVESPEGSTGFEPTMHSTQLGGKICPDDSFPSLCLDTSLQDVSTLGNEGGQRVGTDDTRTQVKGRGDGVIKQGEGQKVVTDDITAGGSEREDVGAHMGTDNGQGRAPKESLAALNSDDVSTQAYGPKDASAVNSTKATNVINSDDVCTQAYGPEDEATNYPNKRGYVSTNSDDISTQAYEEQRVTECPSQRAHIAANSDDISTQAYGEERVTVCPSQRAHIAANSDDISTQAYGEERVTECPSQRAHIAANSDDISTQAYGEERVTECPSQRAHIAANSDDISTQAYGKERVTECPSQRAHIAANSDDISTQAYGEERVTECPSQRAHIAANSDDISTQAYGEELSTNYSSKRARSSVNSDDVCIQACSREEKTVLRSSPRKRHRRKKAVPIPGDDETTSDSEKSEKVESSQPEEDDGDDILMPLYVGKQALVEAEAVSETVSLGDSSQQETSAAAPEQHRRASRRSQSQRLSEITTVETRRRQSVGAKVGVSTTRKGKDVGEVKLRKTAQVIRGKAKVVSRHVANADLSNEIETAQQTKLRARTDGEPLAETAKKPKSYVKVQRETKTRSIRHSTAKNPSVSGERESGLVDDKEEKSVEQSETETRSKRSRKSVVPKASVAAAQEEEETVSVEHTEEKPLEVSTQAKTNTRSTRNRKSVVRSPVKNDDAPNCDEHTNEKTSVLRRQSETKRHRSTRRSVIEKRLLSGESELNAREQEVEPLEMSKSVSRISRSTEKPTMKVRSQKNVKEKTTMSVIAEQKVTKTRGNKENVDSKTLQAEEQRAGSCLSGRRRRSLMPEVTQPKKSRTESEGIMSTETETKTRGNKENVDSKTLQTEEQRAGSCLSGRRRRSLMPEVTQSKKSRTESEGITSTETENKTRSARKQSHPLKVEQRESEPRSVRNRKQTPTKAAKEKESEDNVEELSLAKKQTDNKCRQKRNRESIVENQQDSIMTQGRKNTRHSSVNLTNKNKEATVKATSSPVASRPKQKENVLIGKSPRRRQMPQTSASEEDSSQPSKKLNGQKQPVTPSSGLSTSLRERHPSSRPQVMFTGMFDCHGEQILKSLGGQIVDSVYECTHLVTDRVRRTVKFLCGLGRGIPIVGPEWLHSCRETNTLTNSDKFLLRDEENEKKFHFNLVRSLQTAASGGLLVGYRIHVTANVKPEPKQMKDIIQCAGGEYLSSVPRTYQEKTVVVSCDTDRTSCQRTVHDDIPVVSAEFLLTGILRQEVDVDQHRLTPSASAAKGGRTSRKKR